LDNTNLDQLLNDVSERQYWLKPIGLPGLPLERPGVPVERRELFPQLELEMHFAVHPVIVTIGDILIVFRTGASRLVFVAECLEDARESTPEQQQREPFRQRFPWFMGIRNLTPEYGEAWQRFNLKPFSLVREYNKLHPNDRASIGRIQFGGDKARIPRLFAESLIRRIQAC
jgi:hypothetical protein